ncbi:MAG: alginate lyase family protein [Prevotella sp.]|nr:alginate lyase family protein [Prevotella sp.]MDY4039648.1 alginate lyase family protein [Prevotella sp.]
MKKYLLTTVFLSMSLSILSQGLWPSDHLKKVKSQLHRPFYARCLEQLNRQADRLLTLSALSVTQKEVVPASGDKHDYMSLSRYYWPDPSKPDGLPYINHDGQSNPELKKYDRGRLGETTSRIQTLALAWYLNGDEKYARKATELIRTWFFDKRTYMRPNLDHAQFIPGINGNRGRKSGVLDGYSFVEMLDAVRLLEQSKSFSTNDAKQLRRWFTRFLQWMLTNPLAIDESKGDNNHAVAYDAQVLAYALFTDNQAVARRVIEEFPTRRVFTQIQPDGRQPRELARTLAFGYSTYNLTHCIDIYLLTQALCLRIDQASSADGRSFYKAVDFLLPYVGKDVSCWPYKQISQWESKQQEFCKDLYKIATYIDNSRQTYRLCFDAHRQIDYGDHFYLLYYQPTASDDAMASAASQLSYAITYATAAQQQEQNAARHLVTPRTIGNDGQLVMVRPRDWCSGFFAGSLWQMYRYTHDPYWRQQAISFTWPIESAKNYKGTHDLGFIINCSFGQAFDLTGERSYRDVLITASNSLATRFRPAVGCIRSWDHNRDKWQYPVIIDNMMNLEMLFKATQLTGDSTYHHIAVSHANTTMKHHFRDDYSSFHVVDYDSITGNVRTRCTHQGWADDSYWSRGQGWGLYGYTLCYRYTRQETYLNQARHIADFIMTLPMPADSIFYWDMKCPEIPNTQRDASAAAIVASALYELSRYVPRAQAMRYEQYADHIMNSLTRYYRAATGTHYGFLLLHSVGSRPSNSEVDKPLNYADYYYLEALNRKIANSSISTGF